MRKHYLDNIRWVTVVLVVLYHVVYMYNAEGVAGGLQRITGLAVQPWDAYQYLVYPWIMPVLFLVAGASARYDLDRRTDAEFVRRRTRKLLVPSTVGLVTFQFLQGYVNLSLGNAFAHMAEAGLPKSVMLPVMVASGSGVLWFLHLLWLYSMALVLIRRAERGRLLRLGEKTPGWMLAAFCFPIWGAAQVLNTPVVSVYRFAFYFVFFLLGYFVFSHEAVVERLRRRAGALIVCALLVCAAFCVLYFVIEGGANYADKPVNRSPLFAASAYAGSLAMLGGMARYGDFSTPFTRWMSKRSFGLYVFHYLGISSVALWIARPRLLPAPACYLLSALAGFGGGYLLNAAISRIPFLRWAVLGIKADRREAAHI